MRQLTLIVVPDAASMAERASALIAGAIAETRERQSTPFRLALAGGGTPKATYRHLATRDDVAWDHVALFWGDERVVAADDPSSNFRMVEETLLGEGAAGARVRPKAVHRIETERGASEAASHYARLIGSDEEGVRGLDLVLLGMGGDGHTASLFPGDAASLGAGVLVTNSPVAPHTRISLGHDVIDRSALALMLVSGANKATRLAEVYAAWHGRGDADLPAARVRAAKVVWLVDEDAARALDADARELVRE